MSNRLIFEVKNFIFKFGYLLFLKLDYFKFRKEYKFMKLNQFKSINYNLSLQRDRLFNILDYSIKNIKYYIKVARQNNIKLSKKTIFEDIKKFPILTKEIIRKNWKILHIDLNKIKYRLNTSGGTTGELIIIIQDQNYILNNAVSTVLFDEMGKYFLGDKLIRLWGSEKDIIRDTKGILNILINKFTKNTHFQNAFKMSDIIIYEYINEINHLKPKVIIAYVQSIYEMAKYIKRKNLKVHQLRSIIVSAGILTSDVKKFIESVFKCPVFNRYGSREVGLIASSCEKSDKLHINMYQQYVEILDDNNNPLGEHEKGNIIITNLTNYGMPLVRYKIGDKGALDLSQCPCGRGLIRLDKIYGRVVDIFKNESGELIDGEYFTHLFYYLENIKKFQVVQEKINKINIFLVTFDNNQLDIIIQDNLTKKIKHVMGQNCKVNYNYVSDIEPSSSGKFRYTISKI